MYKLKWLQQEDIQSNKYKVINTAAVNGKIGVQVIIQIVIE